LRHKGIQFWNDGFKTWCTRRGIKPRFGAVGKHGCIAVIERFIRTLKGEAMRRLLIPIRRDRFRRELQFFATWYNEHRPHSALDGRTPNEVYDGLRPANRRPRLEPQCAGHGVHAVPRRKHWSPASREPR